MKGCIEYNYGKITNGNINKFMDYQIVAGSANGGWTRMDYRLVIEPSKSVEPEKKGRKCSRRDDRKKISGKNSGKETSL